jgi:hypothetical protein
MRYWAAVVTPDRFENERLYAHDTLILGPTAQSADAAIDDAAEGEPVALVCAGPEPVVFGFGTVAQAGAGLEVTYTRRLFDHPIPIGGLFGDLPEPPALAPVDKATYERIAATADPAAGPRPRADWLVSVAIPVEAESPAEAVREFWTYVSELGPRELPAFVSPSGNELAMQAYVLGAEAHLDPEEDD